MLHLCTAYPQDTGNNSRSDRESTFFFVTASQHSTVSSASLYNLDSTPTQRRPSLQTLGHSSGGRVHETIQHAEGEANEAPNRIDETQSAQTETHSGVAEADAEPTGPRPR